MTKGTCSLPGCDKPLKRGGYCYGHYMKNWRYGTPTPTFDPKYDNVAGERFGTLVVVERAGAGWLCRCDCGAHRVVRTAELRRTGDANTCARPGRHLRAAPTYAAAHRRVKQLRGTAKAYRCVDCAKTAAHWSYDHRDEAEYEQQVGTSVIAFSLKPEHYEPRCVACHKRFDLQRINAAKIAR